MEGRTYRYFDGEALYPFGYGLSYTQFSYSSLKLDKRKLAADDQVKVSVVVKNTGKRAGEEVVQLYVSPQDLEHARVRQELRGVTRISLKPGESRRVNFTLKPSKDFTYYDEDNKAYAVEPGRYEIRVGASSADIRLKQPLQVVDKSKR